jgi:hypothetical protein
MDAIARVDDDDEAIGLDGRIRRRHWLHRP